MKISYQAWRRHRKFSEILPHSKWNCYFRLGNDGITTHKRYLSISGTFLTLVTACKQFSKMDVENFIKIAAISVAFVLMIILIRSQIFSILKTRWSGFRKNGRSRSTGHFTSTEFAIQPTARDDISFLR